eukprot:scaffold20897_cov17-Tisochrysis_lutea.AAC.2
MNHQGRHQDAFHKFLTDCFCCQGFPGRLAFIYSLKETVVACEGSETTTDGKGSADFQPKDPAVMIVGYEDKASQFATGEKSSRDP